MGTTTDQARSAQTQSSLLQGEGDRNFVFDRLFNNLTLSEKATFTLEQIDILKQACAKLNPRKHPIDVRLSIPGLGKRGMYLVLLAGEERRTATRIQPQRSAFWKSASLVVGVGTLLGLTYVGFRAIAFQLTVSQMYDPHPTSLPWIKDKQVCREQGRVWEGGQCWDAEHSPEF